MLVGTRKALSVAIHNVTVVKRNSRLKERIRERVSLDEMNDMNGKR